MKNSNIASISELDVELEIKIIGGLLFNSESIKRLAETGLEPKHFKIERYQEIYTTALLLHHKGTEVNLLTLCTELQEKGRLEAVGGMTELGVLADTTVGVYNLDLLAELLIKKFSEKNLTSTIRDILNKCEAGLLSPEKIQQELESKLALIKGGKDPLTNALELAKKILLDEKLSDAEREIKLEKLKEAFKVSNYLWDKMLRGCRQEIEQVRLRLELKALLQSEDKLDQLFKITALSQKYRVSVSTLKESLKLMKVQTETPEFEVEELDTLFNSGSTAIDYLVPGLLPKGESALLVAMPKVGKSLLGIDLAFSVATGESKFLGEQCQTGKVLLVSVDESKQSASRKLIKRGFRTKDQGKIKIVTKFNIEQLGSLEKQIEDFRPALVIIDSLKRITKGYEISENSAEFADIVYSVSELCNRYGASCVLIHHSKKNNETTGVENARGSTAITGALGNVWIFDRVGKTDPNNKKKIVFDPKDNKRKLLCYSRDNEGKYFDLELNPENNSWSVLSEDGMSQQEQQEQHTVKERILALLKINHQQHPEGISGAFLHDCLERMRPGEISKGYMYVVLNRLVDDKLINSKPAPGDKRYTLYSLPISHQSSVISPELIENNQTLLPSPPTVPISNDNQSSETYTDNKVQDTYHDNYHTHINQVLFEEKHLSESTSKSFDLRDLEIDIISETVPIGGEAEERVKLKLIENDEPINSKPVEITPVIGRTYLDAEGFPHKIVDKTDRGWIDHTGDVVTPGIFKAYRLWTKREGQMMLDAVLAAVVELENGSTYGVDSLTNATKAQINGVKQKVKQYIGQERWNLMFNYFKNKRNK